MFLYADIQWSTPFFGALAGMNAGDRYQHVTVPGSLTSKILNIEETSNVGIPGVWIFKIGEGVYVSVLVYTHVLMCIEQM